MDENSRDIVSASGNSGNSVGSGQESDGSNANDNRNSVASRRSHIGTQTIAAVIVALAGIAYTILQVYGAVTSNGSKTERLERGISILQTAVPRISQQVAAIPTARPSVPPVIVNTKPGNAPTVIVTQVPAAPGKPGLPGKPGAVKIITVTQSPTPAPTCANSLLGYCLAK